jgi:hypothetical protein
MSTYISSSCYLLQEVTYALQVELTKYEILSLRTEMECKIGGPISLSSATFFTDHFHALSKIENNLSMLFTHGFNYALYTFV